MKLEDLHEMTQKAGDLSRQLKQYFELYASNKHEFVHVGDIEEIKVFFWDTIYLLLIAEDAIAFFQVLKQSDNQCTLQNAYVKDEFRKTGIMSKFLFFLKRNENYSSIIIGDTHSVDMVAALKKIYQRFDAYWEKDGERVKFDPSDTSKYGLMRPTGWKVILENDSDYSEWPKFFEGIKHPPNIRMFYDWLLNED